MTACPLCHSDALFSLLEIGPVVSGDVWVERGFAREGERYQLLACRRCRLVSRYPRPSDADLTTFYRDKVPQLEQIAFASLGVTPELMRRRTAWRFERLFDELRVWRGKGAGAVLDIGGWDGSSLIPWLRDGWRSLVIEPGIGARPVADSRLEFVSSYAELAARGASPTRVICLHVAEHVSDLGEWARSLSNVAPPAALWLLEVPLELPYMVQDLLRRQTVRARMHEQHLNLFTTAALRALASHLGLVVDRIVPVLSPSWFGLSPSLRLFGRVSSLVKEVAPWPTLSTRVARALILEEALRMRVRMSINFRFRHPRLMNRWAREGLLPS